MEQWFYQLDVIISTAAFMLPDSHIPTVTSSALLSLQPQRKVVSSVSRWVRDWWSFQFLNGLELVYKRLENTAAESPLTSPHAAAPNCCADGIRRGCGDFAHCTDPSKIHLSLNQPGIFARSEFQQYDCLQKYLCLLS